MDDLRLGIDVSPLELTVAGTARYLRNLLSHLDGVTVERYAVPGASRSAKVRRDLLWYLRTLPRKAARDGVDVLHCPGHRGPQRSRVPLVVTLHDLAVLRHPETFNRWTRSYSRIMLPRIVEAATRVIAVSSFTAGEAVELLGVDEEKVRVVPHGVEPPFLPEGQEVRGEYALAVGTVEPRKNLPRAVEAAQRAGIELRVVGPEGWGDVGVQSLGFVSDEVLAALYRGAQCLIFTSLYEGFGLPVLEAMAAAGGDVIGLDWRIPLGEGWERVGSDRGVQGNLDPALLLGSWDRVERATEAILEAAGGRHGHIFNLGHGVLPSTDPAQLRRLRELVHERTAAVHA